MDPISNELVRSPVSDLSTVLSRSEWDRKWLLGSHLFTLLLLLVWYFPPTSRGFEMLDKVVFMALNGTLAQGPAWRNFWAIANHRLFDLVSGALVFIILVPYLWQLFRSGIRVPAYTLLALGGAVGVGRALLGELLVLRVLGYHRASPSLVLSPVYRLSELVPEIHAKDASPWSFPGDHGLVLFAVALLLTYQTRGWTRWGAWMAALACSLPRLLSGAHWATDILVGSLSIALVTMGWFLGSPFLGWMQQMAIRHGRRGSV
jgi:Kdo2-lipid A phosphotransferase